MSIRIENELEEKNLEEVGSEKKNIEEKFADFLKRWPKIHELYMKYEEILVYLVVGGLTTVVSWAAKFLWNFIFYDNTSHPTAIQNIVLSTVCWVAGVIFAFFTNRKYVFKSKGPMLKEAPKFVASRLSTYFIDIAIMQVLGTLLGVNVYIATLVSAVVVIVLNYVFSKLFVFNKKKEPNR